MNKIAIIAWREFSETVRTWAFVFGVIFIPGLITAFIFAGEYIAKSAAREKVETRKILVHDTGGKFAPLFSMAIDEWNKQNQNRPFETVTARDDEEEALAKRVRDGSHYAYLVVTPGAIAGTEPVRLARADDQLSTGRALGELINAVAVRIRFGQHDPPLNYDEVKKLQTDVAIANIDPATLKPRSDDDEMARVITPFAFMFLLYMGTFGISMGLLTSVIEEKSSRVVEVLLAAVSSTQLMAGKILGMVLVGVLVMGVWAAVGYVGAQARNVGYMVTPFRLVFVALYFVPGFLFMSSLLAAIGAACNTLKEAQSMSSPLSLINIVPMVMWFQLSQYPNSVLSVVLSYIPPITPFVMILRVCADPDIPIWQIITTQALLWLCVAGMIWAAGRIFRVGILMYGKPPSILELGRWLRQS